MPATLTYPGVYIEEVPSGVRTITGVATSLAAFVGRAARGPVDEPVTISSFGEFERRFGGLWAKSGLGFAVRDFFQNGGAQAVIVRVFKSASQDAAKLERAGVKLEAISPGTWGNKLRLRVVAVPDPPAAAIAESLGVETDQLFTLIVRDTATGEEEMFRNVVVADGPHSVQRAVARQSRLVKVTEATARPSPHAEEPAPGKTVWDDDDASSAVATAAAAEPDLEGGNFTGSGTREGKKGLYALEKADIFNVLCIPPYKASGAGWEDIQVSIVADAAKYCEDRRALLIVDPPSDWNDKASAKAHLGDLNSRSKNAAVYFPQVRQANPLNAGQIETFAPCGAVAGIMARTDGARGVWKAPAGLDATISGAAGLTVNLTDADCGELNPLGINCLRSVPASGRVVWGARTLQGDDRLASEWKYVPVRRLALFIEESLYRGTQWVVFEPNDEPLWSQIRLNVGAFMHNLFRQGAFQGQTPRDAYLVKCDKETTTQNDVNLGIVNIIVGFAPLKPAEFVIIKIQQLAGQAQT